MEEERESKRQKTAQGEALDLLLRRLKETSHQLVTALQNDPTSSPTSDIEMELRYLLVELKERNRESQLEVKMIKSQTQEEKQKMDKLSLQLQNLNYEKQHLWRELQKLKQIGWNQDGLDELEGRKFNLENQEDHGVLVDALERIREERMKLNGRVEELSNTVQDKTVNVENIKTQIALVPQQVNSVYALANPIRNTLSNLSNLSTNGSINLENQEKLLEPTLTLPIPLASLHTRALTLQYASSFFFFFFFFFLKKTSITIMITKKKDMNLLWKS